MKLEDFGYVDIEKKQKLQNQNYENQMHKKFKIGSTPVSYTHLRAHETSAT